MNRYIPQADQLRRDNNVPFSIEEDAVRFLREFWQGIPPNECVGLTAISHIKSGSTSWWSTTGDIKRLLDRAKTANEKDSVYYNAASRKDHVTRGKGRGTKDELLNVTAFWFDADILKQGSNITLAEAQALILNHAPLPPSIIVASGGGLQVSWLLDKPFNGSTPDGVEVYDRLFKAFVAPLVAIEDLGADTSVLEASHIMRLPGSVNRKPERDSAMAQIVLWQPERRYGIEQIKAVTPLPPEREIKPLPPAPDGTYYVSVQFVNLMCNGDTPQGSRHGALVDIALCAANAGIPRDHLENHVYARAYTWFDGDQNRLREVGQTIEWAYTRTEKQPFGHQLVKLTDTGFETVDQQREDIPIAPLPFQDNGLEPGMLHVAIDMAIEYYLQHGQQKRGLLLRASPGAGKTYALWQKAQAYARRGLKVVFLIHNALPDKHAIRAYCKAHNIDPDLCFFWFPRNDRIDAQGNPLNTGYCQQPDPCNAVARKGHNVREKVCAHCPLKQSGRCEQEFYLSQENKARNAAILVARHENARNYRLIENADLVIFDENCLDVIESKLSYKSCDLRVSKVSLPMVDDDLPEIEETLKAIYAAIGAALETIPPVEGDNIIRDENHWLHGYCLMDYVVKKVGEDRIAAASAAYSKHVGKTLDRLSGDYTNLRQLTEIIFHEFKIYQTGAKAWNSRLIAKRDLLEVYPMQPITINSGSKLICADATSYEAFYNHAFVTSKGEPFTFTVENAELRHNHLSVRISGSEFTRWTLKSAKNKAWDGIKAICLDTLQTYGEFLLITYKFVLENKQFRAWAAENGIDLQNNTTHFGSAESRGSNRWRDLNTALIIGTPRVAGGELNEIAQVWHWQDEKPLDFTEAPVTIPVIGQPKGWEDKHGYADQRLEAYRLHGIQSELRQAGGRIRADLGGKKVIIVTAYPPKSQVNIITNQSEIALFDKIHAFTTERAQRGIVTSIGDVIQRFPKEREDTLRAACIHLWNIMDYREEIELQAAQHKSNGKTTYAAEPKNARV